MTINLLTAEYDLGREQVGSTIIEALAAATGLEVSRGRSGGPRTRLLAGPCIAGAHATSGLREQMAAAEPDALWAPRFRRVVSGTRSRNAVVPSERAIEVGV
jgi:hypothetical protein